MQNPEMLKLIADHMEGGFLENIIDMFKHDRALYRFVPALMEDERSRVRIGTVALVEALRQEHAAEIDASANSVAELLGHDEPTIRADAVYLLGIIGGPDVLKALKAVRNDDNSLVRQVIEETIAELQG